MSPGSSLCPEMQPRLGGGGGGFCRPGGKVVLSDSFPISNNSVKQIELESFLFLVRVQPTPFYFCWVGTNLPARLLTTFITHSPGSLHKCILSRCPGPTVRSPPGLRGQAGSPLQEQIAVAASWMDILIQSQPWLLFQCHSWGMRSSRETSPGTLSSNCYTEHGSA